MDSFNFDEIIDRTQTGSIKYDLREPFEAPTDAIPLWVADMDFRTVPEVVEAMIRASQHGIFGYTHAENAFFEALHDWMAHYFDWETQREMWVQTPNVMFGVAAAIRVLTREDDGVLIQTPVYDPFMHVVTRNARRVVINELRRDSDGRYVVDFEDFEAKIVKNRPKAFLLCSPHNPVGRVWSRAELLKMGEICCQHGVKIISDEIHFDFIYPGASHTVFATLSEELAQNCVVCTSPTKTFNLAGVQIANIYAQNAEIHTALRAECQKFCWYGANSIALAAAQAAYLHGYAWRDALIAYLGENVDFVRSSLNSMTSKIHLTPIEGTYLLWLDCCALEKSDAELRRFFLQDAKIWCSPGAIYGPGGSGFMRMNVACPRKILERAMGQLANALD
ncbi:MAG: MalY/PatB family protein [Planctomycetia bacterium]|nr:MalY/PatB family protein [Planctomycetia bacterium]